MSFKVAHTFLACGVLLAACTMGTNSPATAPSTISSVASTSTMGTTSTVLPDWTTTTVDRLTEIAAIFEDLERRRLQAIFDQDEEAFRAVFANKEYEEESMVGMDLVSVDDAQQVQVIVLQIIHDGPRCLAFEAEVDLGRAVTDGQAHRTEHVIEFVGDAWGISWAGRGWTCEGPHPLSP